MSVSKRRLGRGLDMLLGEPREPAAGLAFIPVNAIRPNPQQPRVVFEPAALAELEHSIRELGVLVPVIVRPLETAGNETLFELIAGERRWRAASAAGLAALPAIVREEDDRSSLELAVVENLQRQDLDALEEAMGYQHLLEKYGYTQEALAERLGKSRPAIANALRLLGLSDGIKARLRSGDLSAGHARALLSLIPDRREAFADRIVRDGLSVRDVERAANDQKSKAPRALRDSELSPDLEALQSRFRYALATKVNIVQAAKGGKLEIYYGDATDLLRISDAFLPPDD